MTRLEEVSKHIKWAIDYEISNQQYLIESEIAEMIEGIKVLNSIFLKIDHSMKERLGEL